MSFTTRTSRQLPTSTPEGPHASATSATGRDWAIDATRGLAIWSMIAAHFSGPKSIAGRATHAYPYVDGMAAFVLLSGLVLGIVYSGWIAQRGWGFTYQRLGKRLVVLYLCQVAICLVAVAAGLLAVVLGLAGRFVLFLERSIGRGWRSGAFNISVRAPRRPSRLGTRSLFAA